MSLVLIGAYSDYTGELSLLGKYYSYQVADQSDQSDGQGEQSRAEQVLILTMIIKLSSRSPPGKSDGWAEGGITDGLDLDLDLTGIEINEHQQLSLLTLTTINLTLTLSLT